MFDEGEEEEDSDLDEVREESDDDNDGLEDVRTTREMKLTVGNDDDGLDEVDPDALKVHEIDAYWLQRKCATCRRPRHVGRSEWRMRALANARAPRARSVAAAAAAAEKRAHLVAAVWQDRRVL